MEIQREQIAGDLQAYVARFRSANKASINIGVAASTLSAVINRQWDKISDKMWAKIASAVTATEHKSRWNVAETDIFREVNYVLQDAQTDSAVTWIVGEAGSGKTTAARHYVASHPNAFYILCSEDTKRVDFVRDMARAMGVRVDGSVRQMFEQVMVALSHIEQPLLIFDEADKLTDSVMHYFITIYNRTEDECGIVFLSTGHIRRRMQRGLQLLKRGYQELNSRLGRRFFDLDAPGANDIYAVCVANGLTDEMAIRRVIADAREYDSDMRRVRRVIRKELKQQSAG